MTDANDCAAVPNSSASPSQAAAAASIGAVPAPMNIRKELISGGSTTKLTAPVLPLRCSMPRRPQYGQRLTGKCRD
ncbi:Uncharacterised protein [Mycobacterium tuberculosis]|uniref:Uncharacterized protein n=1 Tax=Mycobacterium tuberculosis TaxID=1773 RepID=A0A0U0TE62_MYCTX|nr:predicted protein [Mycobacterium tuberculosis T85]COX47615.1 Uncharacterised protein [Mycobacterium tuberculosis]